MRKTLTARRLVTCESVIEFAVIELDEEGRVANISSDPAGLADASTMLASALVDLHIHGACGIDVMSAGIGDFQQLQSYLTRHGVAHFLPTTVTAPLDFTLHSLERMAKFLRTASTDAAVPLGIHIEGPFLSHAKRGMHPAEHLQAPSIELFNALQQAAEGSIRMMTIAPELNAASIASRDFEPVPALDLIRHARGQGVACSIGHSNSTADQATAAIEAGATSATHTFNAMRPFDHREPGILGVVLDDKRLYADLICDGIHVAPATVRLWWRCKGPARAILITDALPAAGMANGEYRVGEDLVTVSDGRALVSRDLAQGKETLAGSVILLDQAVTRFVEFTGAQLSDAVQLASRNPATMLNRPEIVRIAPGSYANLTRWDDRGRLVASYNRGKETPA
ncbi:MAG TPA: N-acetylglucosamine-6-phosphate deacetylase [Terracidiphilus sp.]